MKHESRIRKIKNRIKIIIHKSRGFTLIELLIVISIIGILAGLFMANFLSIRQKSRDGVRKTDLRQIQTALEFYRSDQGKYPDETDLDSCGAGVSLDDGGSPAVVYMKKIPCDPLGTSVPYYYELDSTTNTYFLVACLENTNDPQQDPSPDPACASTTNISFTLQNP